MKAKRKLGMRLMGVKKPFRSYIVANIRKHIKYYEKRSTENKMKLALKAARMIAGTMADIFHKT